MYESFYGLKERPFSLLPDPDYLYLSPKHLRALTLLEYGMMNQAGFSVICGDTGAGKTTLIRRLLSDLGEDTTVGMITNTHKSFGELLSWILMAFGLDGEGKSKAHMHQILIEFLIDQYAQNRHSVLIVDEAQNMTVDTLEELRMLSNINSDKDQVLQVILAGQPALRETLRRPDLMQFAQRIAVDYYLESLNRDETCEYIQHRLEVAGGNTDTFTENACHAIYRYSGGTPRLINLLCDTALVYGFAEQTHIIDAPLIEDVVREQHRNSIVPTFNKPLNDDNSEAEKKSHGKQNIDQLYTHVTDAVATTPIINTIVNTAELNQLSEQQPVTAIHQSSAYDYEVRQQVGHSDIQSTPDNNERIFVHTPAAPATKKSAPGYEEPATDNKVTRINKSPAKNSPPANTPEDEHTTQPPAPPHTTKPADDTLPSDADGDGSGFTMDEALYTEDYRTDTHHQSAYKDVYPIVHVTEPKKNFNILILGFAGGMALTSILMFIAVWMMFRNELSPAPAIAPDVSSPLASPQAIPQVEPTPIPSAENVTQLEAIQRERDEARAATEALKRERDAALASAQKQEAIRAAEKRANEIISAQERKYAGEMERVRQRAFEAEISAAKARERERIANEEAERSRLETLRSNTPSGTTPTAQTAPVIPHNGNAVPQQPDKPAASNTKPEADDTTQFSANPCNSPSAKFLSTCKR